MCRRFLHYCALTLHPHTQSHSKNKREAEKEGETGKSVEEIGETEQEREERERETTRRRKIKTERSFPVECQPCLSVKPVRWCVGAFLRSAKVECLVKGFSPRAICVRFTEPLKWLQARNVATAYSMNTLSTG